MKAESSALVLATEFRSQLVAWAISKRSHLTFKNLDEVLYV